MTKETTVEVKFIRLNTGEDIVGNCIFDEEHSILIVDRPLKVVLQRNVEYGEAVLLMMPWLPLEIVEENIATLNYEDILTTTKPKDSFIEFYYDTLTKYEMMFDEDLSGDEIDENELLSDSLENDEEELEQYEKSFKDIKKVSIH
jgi:hypothetical protein